MLVTSTGRRTVAVTAVAAAALVGVAACGSSSNSSGSSPASTTKESPAQAAQTGFSGLAGQNAVTATLKLAITPADLVALSKDDGSKGLTAAQAQVISGGSIVLSATSGGSSFSDDAKSGSASGERVAFTVNGGGAADLFQLVYADKTLYARADVAKVASLAGADTTELDEIGAQAPAQYSFIKDALAGKWLKVDVTQLEALAQQSTSTGTSPQPSVAPSQIAALEAAFTKIFQTDVTVTRDAADPTLGDHLVLKGNSRTVGTDLVTALKASFGSLPGATQAFAAVKPESIPSKEVTVDEYVKNGTLSALKLNLNQFFDATDAAAAKGTDDLELDLTGSATVTPPASATNVDLSGLSGLLSGLGGGAGL